MGRSSFSLWSEEGGDGSNRAEDLRSDVIVMRWLCFIIRQRERRPQPTHPSPLLSSAGNSPCPWILLHTIIHTVLEGLIAVIQSMISSSSHLLPGPLVLSLAEGSQPSLTKCWQVLMWLSWSYLVFFLGTFSLTDLNCRTSLPFLCPVFSPLSNYYHQTQF